MFEIFIEAVNEISGILLVMAAIGVWSFLL